MKALLLRSLFWAADFFKGSPIRKEYRQIRDVMQRGVSTASLLEQLLQWATGHCKYYAPYAGLELRGFPVVNKLLIRENMQYFVVPEEENPWQMSGVPYYIQRTSGSTGAPFALPQDSRKRNHRLAELKYFGEIVGFRSHDPLVQLRIWTNWQSKGKWQSFKENIYPFDCSNMGEYRLGELVNLIKKEKIVCLRAYASSYALLGQYLLEKSIVLPSLKVMISGSEALLDSTRQNIAKSCPNCVMISQYANEENGIMGQEMPHKEGIFELNHAGYYFESLKPDSDEPAEEGEIGRLVVTDLFNYACPLIRYDTGDMCSMRTDEKTGHKYLDKLYGRRLDIVYNTKGEPIFPMYFARVLKNYDAIVQWQFIQKDRKLYELKLLLNMSEEQFSPYAKEISVFITELLGSDAEFSIRYVSEIPVLKSGKRKSCVQEAPCYTV